MQKSRRPIWLQATAAMLLTLLVLPAGCRNEGEKSAPAPPVTVAHPLMRDVTLYEYFTGRVEAIDSVDIRSRVSGYLEEIRFTSGKEIHKDDVLFIIDQRPFKAQVDRQSASLDQAEAEKTLAHVQYDRDIGLQKTDPGAIAQVSIDRSTANVGVQDANVMQARAQLEEAQLNLDYCTITAPISGQISRNYVSIGNLITGGTEQATLLTTIVSVDPVYGYFNVDEHTIERIEKSIREGKRPSINSKKISVELGLSIDGGKYPHKGVVDFRENQISTDTGTLQVRGIFSNPIPVHGDRVLIAGQFVKIRVPTSKGPHLLISAEAVGEDIVGTFVVVVDDDQIARYRYLEVGPEIDGMQVVEQGLSTKDWVVVEGQHNAHPGSKVQVHYPEQADSTAPQTKTSVDGEQRKTISAEAGN